VLLLEHAKKALGIIDHWDTAGVSSSQQAINWIWLKEHLGIKVCKHPATLFRYRILKDHTKEQIEE
jgi:hypothetical protein